MTGGIFGIGTGCYILAIKALDNILKMEIDKKIILKLIKNLELKKSIKNLGEISTNHSSKNIESISEYNLVKKSNSRNSLFSS